MALNPPLYNNELLEKSDSLTELRVSNGQPRFCEDQAGRMLGLHLTGTEMYDEELDYLLSEENNTSALEVLYIARNAITELNLQLPALKFLDARENKRLEKVDLSGCPNLEKVILNRCAIATLILPKEMPKLVQLEVANNQLSALSLGNSIESLRFLDISENHISQLPTALANCKDDFYLLALGNKFDETISGILLDKSLSDEDRRERLKNYLSQFKDTDEEVDTLKVIFLGNTQAGKTSLADIVTGDNKADQGSTPGVNLFEKKINGTQVIGIDFGGQDYYHSIHFPLFNEQALYLLLWGNGQADAFGKIKNATTGHEEDIYPLNYWLGAVEYFMRENRKIKLETLFWKDANLSLYLINNQKLEDSRLEKAIDLNNKDLKEAYGVDELFRFCLAPTASQKDKETAKGTIFDLIREHRILRKQPEFYIDLRNSIRQEREAGKVILSLREFEQSFSTKTSEAIKEAVSNLSYSVACHYLDETKLEENTPFKKELTDNFIVDLGKFTTWLYEILTIPELREKRNGYFGREDALCWLKTDEAKVYLDFILAFMLHHKIIFEIKGQTDTYVVPQYLKPVAQDSGDALFLEDFEAPLVKYEFESYFHSNVLSELIKQCHNHLLQKEKSWKYLMWKNKVVLFDKKEGEKRNLFLDAQMPKEDTLHKPVISLSRHPQKPVNEEFVRKIMEIIENQIKYYDYTKLVRAPNGKYIPFKEIKDPNADSIHRKESDQFVYEKVVYNRSDFKLFLPNEIFSMKKIFISYSQTDELYKNELKEHFVALIEEGKVSTFDDRKLSMGGEWDSELRKKIDDCDIMVCLTSVKFLNTPYVMKVEIPRAIEKGKIIVPIVVGACEWPNTILGKYNGTLKGKVISLFEETNQYYMPTYRSSSREERDMFWLEVVKEFRAKVF